MTILRVRRFEPGVHGQRWDSFDVPAADRTTVLDALFYVLRWHDRSLAFRCACRAAMCGSCGMVVNGTERWRVARRWQKWLLGVVRVDRCAPAAVKDLVVDTDPFFEHYAAVDPFVMLRLT